MVVIKDVIEERKQFEKDIAAILLSEFKGFRKLFEYHFMDRATTKNFLDTVNSEIEDTKSKIKRLGSINKKNPSDKLRDELCDYQSKLDGLYETCSLFYDEKEKLFKKVIRKTILHKI